MAASIAIPVTLLPEEAKALRHRIKGYPVTLTGRSPHYRLSINGRSLADSLAIKVALFPIEVLV